MRKLTIEQFIKDASIKHNNKYSYTKVLFSTRDDKVIITCPIHGDFEQTVKGHRRGAGCLKCANASKISGLDKFIEKANIKHNNKYDYSISKYTKAEDNITIVCPIHGSFEQSANSHLNGAGCYFCGRNKTNDARRLDTKKFIQKAVKVHNNIYNYSKLIYTTSIDKVTIICPVHGPFEQTPSDHLSGKGCSSCAKNGFQPSKPAYLYYLKITTEDNRILYKIGITNRTVNERFNLTDLSKIEIIKQKLYENGQDALDWETKLKRKYKQYQYKGPDILSSGNTELFTEDIVTMYYKDNNF